MKTVKLLRLKTSEDLISFVEIGKTSTTLTYPLSVHINYNIKERTQELVMSYWLPYNLMKHQSIEVPSSEILFITDPKEEFEEYYLNFLDNISDELDSDSSSDVQILLEQFDAKAVNKIH